MQFGRRTALPVLALLWVFGLAPPARAVHEALARELQRLGASIAEEPGDAQLHLLRAEVYREMRRWPEALADLNRAARLAPQKAEHHYRRALLFRDARWEEKARVEAQRFVTARPAESRGYALRGRLALSAGEAAQAQSDLDRALALADAPDADLYADRARASVARGAEHLETALAGLDDGLAQLGPAPLLIRDAIEVEARLERWDAALARLDRRAAGSTRREWWLADRGDLLLRAGRIAEAAAAFRAAQRALAALTPKRRRARAVQALGAHVRARLLELESSPR